MLLKGGGLSLSGKAYGGGGVLTRKVGGGDPVGFDAVASRATSASMAPGADGDGLVGVDGGGPRRVVQCGGSSGRRMARDEVARVGLSCADPYPR